MTISNEEREKLIAACVAARSTHDPVEAERLQAELPKYDENAGVMAVIIPKRKKKAAKNPDNQ